jgi:hypothetical protein
MIFLYGFMAAFCMVFLKGLQYQNVIGGYYFPAVFISYCICAAEVATITFVVMEGFNMIPFSGTGGALGITASMYVHRNFLSKRKVNANPK